MSHNQDFDLQTFMPYLLNRAAEASSQGFQSYYKGRYGMLRTEWRVLFHLGRYGEMTATEICDRTSVHKTKVSRAVSALEKKRFLSRKLQEADRRHEALSLTKAGLHAYSDLSREAQKFEGKLLGQFDEQELAILRRCLIQMAS